MNLDAEGRRQDGKHLTYNDYINVPALLESLRLPEEPPRGVVAARWPERPAGWKPGDPWPRGGNWVHDEALFITTHQAFEVWFRQIRHELSDVLQRAREIAAAHGAAIPLTRLALRDPERAPSIARLAQRLPRTVALAEQSAQRDLVLHDLPAPGCFPQPGEAGADGDGGAEAPCELSWFAGEWDLWSDRVERSTRILGVCVPFYDVLIHMTPASFLAFRDRLAPASGFGSSQFRQIELLLGLRERHLGKFDPARADTAALDQRWRGPGAGASRYRPEDSFARHSPDAEGELARAMVEPSLRDLVYWLLRARELAGEHGELRFAAADRLAATNFARLAKDNANADKSVSAVVTSDTWRDLARVLAHSETVAATALLEGAFARSGLLRFLDACLALDNALLSWRDVHIRFVERVIGTRPGTGGGGLKYLRRSVSEQNEPYVMRGFPCLWEARTALL